MNERRSNIEIFTDLIGYLAKDPDERYIPSCIKSRKNHN